MGVKKEVVLTVVGGVMGLSSMLLAQNQFDSTQKIQEGFLQESRVTQDELGTFGQCGFGMGCGGGNGQCGFGMGCSGGGRPGGGGQCGFGMGCAGQ